jgi:predicted metal-dependent phosphoesterase TrpH
MIDLHTHTCISDGTDTPGELVNKAIATGLSVLAITDHDTIAGWDEAKLYLRPPLQLVLGAEISCQTEDGISVHMLGLLFDPGYEPLQISMVKTRENRMVRMEKILVRLNEAGFKIHITEVLAQLAEGATLGRPHLADALVLKGYVKNREAAFSELLHNDSKYYVSHFSPTPEETIRLIKAAGGVSVIAHPFASLRGRTITPQTFENLMAAGLDGIEIDHRDHSLAEREQLRQIAREFDLAQTGSSDYHGNGKLNHLAEFTTAPEQWEKLESRAKDRRVLRV